MNTIIAATSADPQQFMSMAIAIGVIFFSVVTLFLPFYVAGIYNTLKRIEKILRDTAAVSRAAAGLPRRP